MSDHEDPLDLLDDDGDGVIEMCLLFDDDKKSGNSNKPPKSSGCCVVFLALGASAFFSLFVLSKFLT